jgi:hypothetical protein
LHKLLKQDDYTLSCTKPIKAVPGETHKYKLRTAPSDGNSPQYELTVAYFSTEFCERLETLDDESEDEKPSRKRAKRKQSSMTKTDGDDAGDKYCLLHGHKEHDSNDCFQLKALAKRHKISHKKDSKKGNYGKSNYKSYKKDNGKPQYTQNELNTIVKAMVKKELRGTKKRKRAVAKTSEELNNFENLSISGSEDDQHDDSTGNQSVSEESSANSVESESS